MSKAIGITAVSLIALGGAYTGGSWWLGQAVEQHYNAHLDQLIAEYGADNLKLQSRHYERGIFGAHARVVLTVTLPRGSKGAAMPGQASSVPASAPAHAVNPARAERPPVVLQVHLKQDITHGPLAGGSIAAASVVTRLDHVEGLPTDDEFRNLTKNLQAPTLTTVHGFGNSLSGKLNLPAGEVRDPDADNNHLRWQALDYSFALNADRTQVAGAFNWPLLSVSMGDTRRGGGTGGQGIVVEMRGASGVYDMTLNKDLWLMSPGRQEGHMDRIEVQRVNAGASPSPLFSLQDIAFRGRTRQEGQLLNAQQSFSGKARIADVPLENISVEAKVSRIDARALREIQGLVLRQMENAGKPVDMKAFQPDFSNMMGRLLEARPEISEKITLTMAGKTGELNFAVSVKEPAAVPVNASLQERFANSTTGEASLRLPKAWAGIIGRHLALGEKMLHDMAGGLAAQGFIHADEEAWSSTARFEDGSASINGRKVF